MKSNLRRRFGSLVVAVLIGVLAILWIASGELLGGSEPEARKEPAKLAALEEIPEVRVRRQTAETHAQTLRVQARTEADRKVTIRAETGGRVKELLVERGDHVETGEVLAQLDEEDRPAQLARARARLEQRRIELDAAQQLSERGFRAKTQLAEARAAYEDAKAAVQETEVELDNTTIFAPFAGEVGDTMVEVGDYLATGGEVLRMLDLDPIRIVADVNERNVAGIEPGGTAQAELVTGESVEGRITFVASESDETTRTFRVEMTTENAEGSVRDGVTAEMSLPLRARKAHFVSPSILTLGDDGQVGVKIVDADNRVRFQEVDVLADRPDGVWITGLPETVTFVTLGQNFINVGQEVKPVEESEVVKRLQDTPLDLPEGAPGKPGPEARP